MKPKKVTGFACLCCDEFYDEEYDAENCCPRDMPEEVSRWQCQNCDEIYEDKEDAKECCK